MQCLRLTSFLFHILRKKQIDLFVLLYLSKIDCGYMYGKYQSLACECIYLIFLIIHHTFQRKRRQKKPRFIFEKVLDFLSLLWYVVVLTGGATYEKYDSLSCAFALLRSELVAMP